MKNLKPKYVLYARKSTEDDDKQVMSIEAQLFELREYARREQLEILAEFQESKSAKTPGREVFGQMMDMVEHERTGLGILAWHPDRLARNSIDGGRIVYAVDTERIVSLRFPTFWFEPTPQGKFMLQVAFGQSKYFSDNLVENVKRDMRQKLRRGEWLTKAPYGYVNNLKTRNIEPHPVYSKIVVKAFEEYATGAHTIESLAKYLADLGLETRNRTPLGKASVVRLLTNRAYVGFIKHHDEWYPGSFAPIVTPSLFEAAQKILQAKRRPRVAKQAHDFPLTQMAVCGECGGMITAQYTTNRHGTRYTYYRCTQKKGACRQPYVSAASLEAQVNAALQTVALPVSEIDKVEQWVQRWQQEQTEETGSAARDLKKEIATTQDKLDRLVSLYLDGDIEREQYLIRKDSLMREKAGFEEKLAGLGHGRNERLQPLRRFVLSLREAPELETHDEMRKKRDFLKSLGSNPSLKAKTLSWHWDTLWDGAAQAKADFAHGGAVWARRAAPVVAAGGLAPEFVSIGDPITWLSELVPQRNCILSSIQNVEALLVAA